MDQAITFMAGISFLILGFSYLSRSRDWVDWIEYMKSQGRRGELNLGIMHLVVGTFILGFHWKWQGWALLLTLVGGKATLEAFVYLLFPGSALSLMGKFSPYYPKLLRVAGVVTILVALVVLKEWWGHMQGCIWEPCFNQA